MFDEVFFNKVLLIFFTQVVKKTYLRRYKNQLKLVKDNKYSKTYFCSNIALFTKSK